MEPRTKHGLEFCSDNTMYPLKIVEYPLGFRYTVPQTVKNLRFLNEVDANLALAYFLKVRDMYSEEALPSVLKYTFPSMDFIIHLPA